MRTKEDVAKDLKRQVAAAEDVLKAITALGAELDSMDEDSDWISVKTASRVLSVSESAIRKRIHSGKLPSKFIGSRTLVRKSDLLAQDDS